MEVKFRIIDKKDNKTQIWEVGNLANWNLEHCLKEDRFSVYQYANYKDIDGVEVFEDDIVRIIRKDNFFGGKNIIENVHIGSPTYYELSDQSSGGADGNVPIIGLTVIGNIREHKYLLK